jgi:hypothetical protein
MLPLKRTLGDMRGELQTRLGFGMSGQAGIVNAPIMDSFLRSAQEQLYAVCDWRELVTLEERETGTDQAFYDYPADCNVERIRGVAIWDGGFWQPLVEGIDVEDRSTNVYRVPLKYERGEQMEVWPVPNGVYRMRRDYVKTLAPFSESAHRSSLPSEMVFLVALANAKAHYRQPDAGNYQAQADALMLRLRAQHRGKSVYTATRRDTRSEKDRFYDKVR